MRVFNCYCRHPQGGWNSTYPSFGDWRSYMEQEDPPAGEVWDP